MDKVKQDKSARSVKGHDAHYKNGNDKYPVGSDKVNTTSKFSISQSDKEGLRMKISLVSRGNNQEKIRKHSKANYCKRTGDSSSDESFCSDCNNTNGKHPSNSSKTAKKKLSKDDRRQSRKRKTTDPKTNVLSNAPVTGFEPLSIDCGSSDDMELPAIVSAAIQRVEDCSDSESAKISTNTTHYTSSLLQDFMAKTKMIDYATENNNESLLMTTTLEATGKDSLKSHNQTNDTTKEVIKRKRGRPKKVQQEIKEEILIASNKNNSCSPDSGIQIPGGHSPVLHVSNVTRKVDDIKVQNTNNSSKSSSTVDQSNANQNAIKLNIAKLEKNMYATERVLYPPPRRRKQRSLTMSAFPSEHSGDIDPMWRKIDVNQKFSKPQISSGYKSDSGEMASTTIANSAICSKILAAKSGYLTDFGYRSRKSVSGYKSDYSTKSYRRHNNGYKSDYSCKSRSCGYQSDYTSKSRIRVRRKRRLKSSSKPSRTIVNDQDILQLADLNLGHSSSGDESVSDKNKLTVAKKVTNNISALPSAFTGQPENNLLTKENLNRLSSKSNCKDKFYDTYSRLAAKKLPNYLNYEKLSSPSSLDQSSKCSHLKKSVTAVAPNSTKAMRISVRRSSATSHASSVNSRCYMMRRKRKRLKSFSGLRSKDSSNSKHNNTKILQQIEQLANKLSQCKLSSGSSSKDKNQNSTEISKTSTVKRAKKRKNTNSVSENGETHTVSSKRRNKKTASVIDTPESSEDHKLPLKKRHYLLESGEKVSSGASSAEKDHKKSNDEQPRAATPKKRHLLDINDTSSSTNSSWNEVEQRQKDSKKSVTSPLTVKLTHDFTAVSPRTSKRSDSITRKKIRLEGLVTKMQPSGSKKPPPGVFEPSLDSSLLSPPLQAINMLSSGTLLNQIKSNSKSNETNRKVIVDNLLSKATKARTLSKYSKSDTSGKKKRRKTINRTGFPTIKKKKKKNIAPEESTAVVDTINIPAETDYDLVIKSVKIPNDKHDKNKKSEETVTRNKSEILSIEDDPLPESQCTRQSILNTLKVDTIESSLKKNRKKQYLVAGLFSDYYKASSADGKNKTIPKSTVDTTVKKLLHPPSYCEKYFRHSLIDFQLPLDIWKQHNPTNSKNNNSNKNTVPSWNYKKLRTNIYNDIKPTLSVDQQPCCCKPDQGCTDDCINRLMYIECSPSACPCGDKCQNQKIQRYETAPHVERFMTDQKGFGVRTNSKIRKNTYILEYVGEVVTEKEFKERMRTLYVDDTHHYCLYLDGGLVIDGHRSGSNGRFVNHSCKPNCEMQKWTVNGLFRMVLFALRDIEPGEELTYDYNFSLFNTNEGQLCKCGEKECRGVIGIKSQRVKHSDPKNASTNKRKDVANNKRKRQAKKNQINVHSRDNTAISRFEMPTNKELTIIRGGHCFLYRNLKKIRRRLKDSNDESLLTSVVSVTHTNQSTTLVFPRSLLHRKNRNIKTRSDTLIENDPKVAETSKIYTILKGICDELFNIKDESDQILVKKLAVPSKKKSPQYHKLITKPIDSYTINSNLDNGHYTDLELFDADIQRFFENSNIFFGSNTPESGIIKTLMKAYEEKQNQIKQTLRATSHSNDSVNVKVEQSAVEQNLNEIDSGAKLENVNPPTVEPQEDIIRCICGLFKDEGIMIQCGKCYIWQHTECVQVDISIENYLCERCEPRVVDLEIPLNEFTDDGNRYYLSLLRKDLQVRQGDTVYVLRDIPIKSDNKEEPPRKHTFETIGQIDWSQCDIFRVERLWKDKDGNRIVYGHHYLRPHETFHEPTRKFYKNEVVRAPIFEKVNINLIMGRCWVLHPTDYCKGRPVNCKDEHTYICELRVDKMARLFFKVPRNSNPVCTKPFAFIKFNEKLKIYRTYAPHDVEEPVSQKGVKRPKRQESISETKQVATTSVQPPPAKKRKVSQPIVKIVQYSAKAITEKKMRLNGVLLNLFDRLKKSISTENINLLEPPLDLSYLLVGRGSRRRTNPLTVPSTSV